MTTIVLLLISNVFMTFAWYGHLKHKTLPLVTVILVSRGIAFFEYCFQVPANRMGHGQFSAAQLKTIQEVISLVVFAAFSVLYLLMSRFSLYALVFATLWALDAIRARGREIGGRTRLPWSRVQVPLAVAAAVCVAVSAPEAVRSVYRR